VQAVYVDMWLPFKQSITEWLRNWRILYDKFHIMKHA
jgi:transposase